MESDLDESYLQKIKGLRQTEQKFKSFLETYPSYRDEEEGRISENEGGVKEILEETAKIIHVTKTLPEEAAAFSSISTNLKHKEKELGQNIDTMENLSHGIELKILNLTSVIIFRSNQVSQTTQEN